MGVRVGVENFFLINRKKFLSSMKIVGVTGLGGLWALKWAWQTIF